MIYKLFTYLSLTSALLTTMNSCFAMEPEDPFEGDKGIVQRFVKADDSDKYETLLAYGALTRLIEHYGNSLAEICKMNNSPEKEADLDKFVKRLDSLGIENLVENNKGKYVLQLCLAKALKGQGVSMLSPFDSDPTKITLESNCERLSQTVQVLRRSLQIFKLVESSEVVDTSNPLARALVYRSSLDCQRAMREKAVDTILELYSEAHKTAKEAYELSMAITGVIQGLVMKHVQWTLQTSLQHSIDLFDSIFNRMMSNDSNGLEKYNDLIKDAAHLKKLIHFVTDYFLSGFYNLEWSTTEVPSQKRGRGKAQQTKQKTPVRREPRSMVLPMWNAHCEALKRASDVISNFDKQNGAPEPRGQDDLRLAYDTYKEKCYQGEYNNNPEQEQAVILARLESLVGNEAPLKEFYRNLRTLRKAQQEQAKVRQIKEQQEAMAQHLRDQEEQANAQQPPKRREEKKQAEANQTPLAEPSFESSSSDEKQPEATPPTKIKPKRRGIPDPSKANQPPQKVLRNEPAPVVQNITVLKLEDYQVFLSLIGERHDGNITLDEVIRLLGNGLRCRITPGGNHRKATAQNGAEWTIPPAWDGSIYRTGYQHQLMDFLLGGMELNPAFVRARGN